MKLTLLAIIVLLSISCNSSTTEETSSEDSPNNEEGSSLSVLVVTGDQMNLDTVMHFATHMPNYQFSAHIASQTLTTAKADSFDVILYFTNSTTNAKVIGDSLYHYVMNDGKLLLATFYSQQESTSFGDLASITPVDQTGSAYTNDTLIVEISNPIVAGIDTLIEYYGAGADTLRNSAVEVARWKNGDILAAYNEFGLGRILYISIFPAEYQYNTALRSATNTDNVKNFFRLWSNAIRYAHSKQSFESDFNYVEPVVSKTSFRANQIQDPTLATSKSF